MAERYEHRSLIITCDRPFADWNSIFTDQTMTVAAIDRLVHHATILEFGSESYRKRAAATRALSPGIMPPASTTKRSSRPRTSSSSLGNWSRPAPSALRLVAPAGALSQTVNCTNRRFSLPASTDSNRPI
ncbi:MAG: ATP-binding protein [Planctomycetes bacterium]|nr:ATP-binding protein [Planctomycetota bacterium]